MGSAKRSFASSGAVNKGRHFFVDPLREPEFGKLRHPGVVCIRSSGGEGVSSLIGWLGTMPGTLCFTSALAGMSRLSDDQFVTRAVMIDSLLRSHPRLADVEPRTRPTWEGFAEACLSVAGNDRLVVALDNADDLNPSAVAEMVRTLGSRLDATIVLGASQSVLGLGLTIPPFDERDIESLLVQYTGDRGSPVIDPTVPPKVMDQTNGHRQSVGAILRACEELAARDGGQIRAAHVEQLMPSSGSFLKQSVRREGVRMDVRKPA